MPVSRQASQSVFPPGGSQARRRSPSRERRRERSPDVRRALCFNARSCQKPHPEKIRRRQKDADATLAASMCLGVADGVSRLEEFGLDASKLPRALLQACGALASDQLLPGENGDVSASYSGPVPLLREAFENTPCQGSAAVMIALMDNSGQVLGKPCPMVSVVSVGDCELLVLRRGDAPGRPLEVISQSGSRRERDSQRASLRVTRVDRRIDPMYDEAVQVDVIERGSMVTCVLVKEGDVLVSGTKGVFDNLFVGELVDLCNAALEAGRRAPASGHVLAHLAQCIVMAAHAKTRRAPSGARAECPIGVGGKEDDTSVVVGEVVELTETRCRQAQAESPTAGKSRAWDQDLDFGRILETIVQGMMPNTSCCRQKLDDENEINFLRRADDMIFAEDKWSVISDGGSGDQGRKNFATATY